MLRHEKGKRKKIRFYRNELNRVRVISNLKRLKDEREKENGYSKGICKKKKERTNIKY